MYCLLPVVSGHVLLGYFGYVLEAVNGPNMCVYCMNAKSEQLLDSLVCISRAYLSFSCSENVIVVWGG